MKDKKEKERKRKEKSRIGRFINRDKNDGISSSGSLEKLFSERRNSSLFGSRKCLSLPLSLPKRVFFTRGGARALLTNKSGGGEERKEIVEGEGTGRRREGRGGGEVRGSGIIGGEQCGVSPRRYSLPQ